MNFSLIGLLATLCVTAILAANAMPSGLQQAERAQVKAAIRDLQYIRSDLSAHILACDMTPVGLTLSSLPHYPVPTNCADSGKPYTQGAGNGAYVSALNLQGMQLTATLGAAAMPALAGQQIVLTGKVINSAIAWTCSGPAGMVSPTC